MKALSKLFLVLALAGIAVLAGCASSGEHTTIITRTWGGGVPADYYRDYPRVYVQPAPVLIERRIVQGNPSGLVARVTTSEDVCIEPRSGGYCIYQPLYHQNVLVESRWVWVLRLPRSPVRYTYVPAWEYLHSSHGRMEWPGRWQNRPRSDVGCIFEEGCVYSSSIDDSDSFEEMALLK